MVGTGISGRDSWMLTGGFRHDRLEDAELAER
jgi:hypothetical protein